MLLLLSNLFTGNDARARLVVKAVEDKVTDPGRMRALRFCVSVAHALFMAEFFRRAGLNAIALSGDTPGDQRKSALNALRTGELQVIFSVDLFNEGLTFRTSTPYCSAPNFERHRFLAATRTRCAVAKGKPSFV